ncbi:hypothetical protein ACCO45_011083 [Purpureocillium lilacinum]|uniref:Uncharacterized protein n=1 Tax=Purpureocillium lilacinum TaxID=33203 RepID=A0ACC4DJM3_PURLI|nr:hypothetical protein PLICBS_000999 [Purpureocillium lilacinum]
MKYSALYLVALCAPAVLATTKTVEGLCYPKSRDANGNPDYFCRVEDGDGYLERRCPAAHPCKPLRGRSHNKCWYYFENDLPKSAKCSSEV